MKGITKKIDEIEDIEISKELPDSFEQRLHTMLDAEREQEQSTEEPDSHFHVTQLVSPCQREIFYKKSQPKNYPVETLKIFKLGDLLHRYLESLTPELDNEVYVNETYDDISVAGYVDLVGENGIIEIKSVSNLYYVQEQPRHEDVLQAQLYMALSKRNKARVVYVQKTDLAIAEHEIAYNPHTVEQVLDKARNIYQCLQKNKAPDPHVCWKCKFCLYQEECENGTE